MAEPVIRVVLFSALEGIFRDAGGRRAEAAYNRLCGLGMQVVFVSDESLDAARSAVAGLDPEAPVLAAGAEFWCPPPHPLAPAFARMGSGGGTVASLISAIAGSGDYLIPVGIGAAAAPFMALMQVAAVVGPGESAAPTIYRCRLAGPDAWEEWAGQMTRRIRIILTRDEMRARDGEASADTGAD